MMVVVERQVLRSANWRSRVMRRYSHEGRVTLLKGNRIKMSAFCLGNTLGDEARAQGSALLVLRTQISHEIHLCLQPLQSCCCSGTACPRSDTATTRNGRFLLEPLSLLSQTRIHSSYLLQVHGAGCLNSADWSHMGREPRKAMAVQASQKIS